MNTHTHTQKTEAYVFLAIEKGLIRMNMNEL